MIGEAEEQVWSNFETKPMWRVVESEMEQEPRTSGCG